MGNFIPKFSSPTTVLYLFLVATQVVTGFYLPSRTAPPPAFSFLYPLALLWAVGWWLRDDSRKRGVGWVFDMGLFLYIAWPIFMPYYLLKTRGARGLLSMLASAAAYAGGFVAGVSLYFVFID